MILRGVAVAMTGKNHDVNIMVTSIQMEEGAANDNIEMGERCYDFRLDLCDKGAVIDAFNRVATTFNEVVDMQERHLAKIGEPYRPVALIVGDKQGGNFDYQSLHKTLFNLPDELKLQREDMRDVCEKLSQSLRKSVLKIARFTYHHNDEVSSRERLAALDKENEFLARKKAELDTGEEEALEALVNYALRDGYNYGLSVRKSFSSPDNWRDNWHLRGELDVRGAQYNDERGLAPVDSYAGWHPTIKLAFNLAFKRAVGFPANIECKLPYEKRSRFFQDPLRLMVMDQLDVAHGRNSEHNISINYRDFEAGLYCERFSILSSLS